MGGRGSKSTSTEVEPCSAPSSAPAELGLPAGDVESAMESLPDELLVEVLSYLDTVQLVTGARAVCRRWRELALSPDAWSHRELRLADFLSAGRPGLLQHILDVAPRVWRVSVCTRAVEDDLMEPKPPAEELSRTARTMLDMAGSTSCSAQCLELEVSRELQVTAEDCLRLLRHHLGLGRVRRLAVRVNCSPAELSPLLAQVAELPLQSLAFLPGSVRQDPAEGDMSWAEALSSAPWGRADIRRLDLSGIAVVAAGQEEDYASALLGAAAAVNVEELVLSSPDLAVHPGLPLGALRTCGFPRLRRLHIAPGDDMEAALGCPALRSLVVYLTPKTAQHPELPRFFRRATALTELHLHLAPSSVLVAVELLEQLSVTGRSSLQKLTLESTGRWKTIVKAFVYVRIFMPPDVKARIAAKWFEALSRLPSALKGLPELRHLTLDFPWEAPPDRVIATLEDFAVVPGLQVLKIYVRFLCQGGPGSLSACNPAFPVFRLVLRAAPRLHVTLAMEYLIQPVPQCLVHWHPVAIGFYAHPQGEPCKLHDNSVKKWRLITSAEPSKDRRENEIVGPINTGKPFGFCDKTIYHLELTQTPQGILTWARKIADEI